MNESYGLCNIVSDCGFKSLLTITRSHFYYLLYRDCEIVNKASCVLMLSVRIIIISVDIFTPLYRNFAYKSQYTSTTIDIVDSFEYWMPLVHSYTKCEVYIYPCHTLQKSNRNSTCSNIQIPINALYNCILQWFLLMLWTTISGTKWLHLRIFCYFIHVYDLSGSSQRANILHGKLYIYKQIQAIEYKQHLISYLC